MRSEAMFKLAKASLFEMATTRPSVEVVQAACLLSCRQFGYGHENEAWVLHGIGSTVTTALSLHIGADLEKWIGSRHLSAEAAGVRIMTFYAHVLVD
jgi:hypothetical protein